MVKPMLGQVIECMTGPQSVWIKTKSGKDIYCGFVGNLKDAVYDKTAAVERINLHIDMFNPEIRKAGKVEYKQRGKKIEPKDAIHFEYSNLIQDIWQEITIEG